MSESSVFRKVSLDRLSSPERLDELLPVTDTRGWIALVALGVVLLTAAVWGVLGSIPQNVRGTGVLVQGGGVFEVVPIASGHVTDILVAVGDHVKVGQVVGHLAQPELSERLQQAQAARAALDTQHKDLVSFGNKGSALQGEHLERQRAGLRIAIAAAKKTLAWEARKLQQQKRLVAEGLILRQTLLDTAQRYDAARERVNEANTQLAQIDVAALEQRSQRHTDVFASEVKVTEAQRLIDEVTRELKSKTEIVSPYTGRILEVLTERGRMAAAGEPLLRLDEDTGALRKMDAVIYVPSVYGKQIHVGMTMLVSPSTVKQEEFGQILATVTYVSDYPATTRGMQRTLKNEQLVASLAGRDAPFEVHAELVPDATTVSRFKWSSSKGPPVRVESGALANANITVDRRRPVELVLPLLREVTGI